MLHHLTASLLYYMSSGNDGPMGLLGSVKMMCETHCMILSGRFLLTAIGEGVADSQGVTSRGALVLRARNLFPVETSREGAEELCGLSSVPSPL